MIDTEKMLDELIERNIQYNKELEFNQKGYYKQTVNTNYPEQFSSKEGYQILSYDEEYCLYKVEYYIISEPLYKSRLKEKPLDIDKNHYVTISYKNGEGAFIINLLNAPDSLIGKINKAINKIV